MGAAESSLEAVDGPTALAGSEDLDEQLLLQLPECFVYRVPPRPRADGHVAASWGLESPLATARLRVTSLGARTVVVALWRPTPDGAAPAPSRPSTRASASMALAPAAAGQSLLALARFDVGPSASQTLDHHLEPTLDSSRYFALRCVAGGGGAAAPAATRVLGIGFRERETAFSLKAALADFARGVTRQARGTLKGGDARDDERSDVHAMAGCVVAAAPLVSAAGDTRGGETPCGTAGAGPLAVATAPAVAVTRAQFPRAPVLRPPPGLLRSPPPSGGEAREQQQQQQQQPGPADTAAAGVITAGGADEEEFGEFTSG